MKNHPIPCLCKTHLQRSSTFPGAQTPEKDKMNHSRKDNTEAGNNVPNHKTQPETKATGRTKPGLGQTTPKYSNQTPRVDPRTGAVPKQQGSKTKPKSNQIPVFTSR